MDLTSLITIIVVVVAIYLVIKLIVSPLIRAAVGVIVILIAIYILQKFFNFNLDNVFGPFAVYLDISKWGINLNWLLNPINYLINKAMPYAHSLFKNIPNNIKL